MSTNKLRREGWQLRLGSFIESRRLMPFAWGTNDCCQFALQAINAMADGHLAGPNFILASCGAYKDRRAAWSRLRMITGKSTYDDAMRSLPGLMCLPEIAVGLAGRGDLVLLRQRAGACPAFGVVSLDARYAVAPGPDGLTFTDTLSAERAWRVE